MELETSAYRVILKDRGSKGEAVEVRALPRSPVVMFLENVRIEPRGCWEWTGYVDVNGYGRTRLHGRYKTGWAHRVSYELLREPIPEGAHVDHLCRVRTCVNPDHLEAVTPQENVRRGAVWTACAKWHPSEPSRWRQRGDGRTYCLECNRAREAERRASVMS